MKSVLKNVNILNLILLAVAAGLFFALVYPLLNADVKVNVPRLKTVMKKEGAAADFNVREYLVLSPEHFLRPFNMFDSETDLPRSEKGLFPQQKAAVVENMPTSLDFVMVTEKNLFHPERKMPLEKKAEQQIARPEIIFYGAIITSEKRIAYIEDKKNPYSTPGRGKRQTPVVQGAMIGGYKLTEVNPENIVLVRGDDKMVVNLRDEKDRKATETTATQRPAQAITTSPMPSKPQAPAMPPVPGLRPSDTTNPAQRGTGPVMPQRPQKYPPRTTINNP